MRIKPGWRYRVVRVGEGEFEGMLLGPAGADVFAEGGGEAVMARHHFQLDSGEIIEIQEGELRVLQPRGFGDPGGPVTCRGCKGAGRRQSLGGPPTQTCQVCGGEGIKYPQDDEWRSQAPQSGPAAGSVPPAWDFGWPPRGAPR